ncbi:hypothetical protein J2Z83_003905 [Virgibacillus natechei]|uniref:Uncharacterized protein n=1 Tax=Virgibacillus natechei TaxID=1216297 RepID=A0ABS4IMG0_9BACI|nr:hypothetical protein [Virgibacillus natechei]
MGLYIKNKKDGMNDDNMDYYIVRFSHYHFAGFSVYYSQKQHKKTLTIAKACNSLSQLHN